MSRLSAIGHRHGELDPEDADWPSRGVRQARDVMVSTPKTLPASASVEDARALLTDDHVHMVLLTHGDKLCGTLVRTDLSPGAPGHDPAFRWAVLRGRTVSPDTPADVVKSLLIGNKMRRLAVVDADRTLLGLVCLKRSGSGCCSDADVAARASAAAANPFIEDPR